MALGLYAGRVAAEAIPRAWHWWQLLPYILVGLALGMGATLWAARRLSVWPWALTTIYVLWPAVAPHVAAMVGLAAVIAWLTINHIPGRYSPWQSILVATGALALYLITLAPDLQPADAGEFQVVAATLGIAHPPGYPLYTMVGKLFTLIPWQTPAWMMNFFAAVCAALCVGTVAHTAGKETDSGLAALMAGASLAITPTFWVQGTWANIRSLTALLVALGVAQALRWQRTRETRDLALLGLVLGLGIGHHSSLGLLLPAYIGFVLRSEPGILTKPRRWLGMFAAALASLAVIAYLPLRSQASPTFALSTVDTWQDLINHVLATGFRGDMLRYTTAADLWRRIGALSQILYLEHGYLLLGLALLATLTLIIRRPRPALLICGIWLLNVLSVLTYSAPQTVEYLLPSYVAFALILGHGLGELWRARSLWPPALLASLVTIALFSQLQASWPGMRRFARDEHTRQEAEALLLGAPQDALILSGWHQATPLWYLQIVEGRRPDVTVTYVYPQGATPNDEVWLRRIHEALPERPVLITNRFTAFTQTGLLLEPLASGWHVRQEPRHGQENEVSDRTVFDDMLAVASWQMASAQLSPGETLQVEIELLSVQHIDSDVTAFAQVIGPNGVVAQDDQPIPSARLGHGDALSIRLTPTILLHCPPGNYALIFGLYRQGPNGPERLLPPTGDSLSLGTIVVEPQKQPNVSAHPLHWKSTSGLIIHGLDADGSIPGQTRLYVHIGAAGELESGLVLVASHRDIELSRSPIPTLTGDQYALLALDFATGPADVTLTVHDGTGPIASLGPWHRHASPGLQIDLTRLGERFVPLGAEMTLTRWTGICETSDCTLQATFLSQDALVRDYAISFGVRGKAEIKSDGTPVTGALPTLKWLPGWRVVDSRELTLQADEQPTIGVLTVYDSFTLKTLPILDERLARIGQGTELLLPLVH